MNKRAFLSVLGGGVVVAAAAGLGLLARGPATALEPWETAGQSADPRRRALSYALLAPSAHNLQPWLVDLSSDDEIVLHVDGDRLIPQADPFGRQAMIGLGAFLELLVQAAANDGLRSDIELLAAESGDKPLQPGPVARIRLVADPSVKPDPLFAHVLARHSSKQPFDLNLAVSGEDLSTLTAAAANGARVGTSNDPATVVELRKLTCDALLAEMQSPAYEESVSHYRLGRDEIDASPDGIAFSGLFFEALIALGQFSREGSLDKSSSVFASGRDKQLGVANTGMAYVWLTTAGNTRADQIAAGRDWVRLCLAAAGAGLGIHPLSSALEEFPAMSDLRQAAHKRLAKDGETVQMLARLGHAANGVATPRWSLEHKIIETKA